MLKVKLEHLGFQFCGVCSISAAALLMATPAKAEEHLAMRTGNDALATCTKDDPSEFWKKAICMAWMGGVRDGHYLTMAFFGSGEALFCVPEDVTNNQFADMFIKYLRANPERRHEPASGLYVLSLMEAFPCHDDKHDD